MTSKTRLFVLLVSAPIIAFAVIGGFLSRAMATEDSYQHLRIFEDVVSLIMSNYVEPVEPDGIMTGAMHGLADGLDADSAYLSPEEVATRETPPGDGLVGLEITRQYYLRVIAAREGSPAARAGLTTGDYIRAIDGESTRDMSVYAGRRALRGAPGTTVALTVLRGNAADPHELTLERVKPSPLSVRSRVVRPGIGLVRVPVFTDETADELTREVGNLRAKGIAHLLIDLRGTAVGEPELGVAPARLFVKSGVIAVREGRTTPRAVFEAEASDGSIALPMTLLVDNGTSSAAEVFAGALTGHNRATLVGEHTLGRAAQQEFIALPDGSGLWLSTSHWVLPDGEPLHAKGLAPTVEVTQPDVEFGAPPPPTDPILEKAIERAASELRPAA